MGIILIMVALCVVGILLLKFSMYEDWMEITGGVTLTISAITLGILILIAIINNVTVQYDVIRYNQTKALYYSAVGNSNLTGEERTSVLDKCSEWNATIDTVRYFDKSFWVGIYYASKIAQLETFDISKIQSVRLNIQINK